MKLLFIALYDILLYLIKQGTRKEYKAFLYAFFQIIFIIIFGTLTAPIFWPIYYLNKKRYFKKINLTYEGVYNYENTELLKKRVKERLNIFDRFIYLYGDRYSPTCLKLPDFVKEYKSWFWTYFIFSAIRNPFFNYHYFYMITKNKVKNTSDIKVILDKRTENIISSNGIASVNSGKYFFWREDKNGNPYFCYRNNTNKYLFYFEYCGLENLYGYEELDCRLEISIRKIKK